MSVVNSGHRGTLPRGGTWHSGGNKMPVTEHTELTSRGDDKAPPLFDHTSSLGSYALVKGKVASEMTDTRLFITFGKLGLVRFNLTKKLRKGAFLTTFLSAVMKLHQCLEGRQPLDLKHRKFQ